MEISIITPIRNQKEITENYINSLLRNSPKSYELILIDNASDNLTRDYLNGLKEKIENLVLIRNEENIGSIKARNNAAKISRGDFLCITDNDIVINSSSCFSISIDELKKDPKLAQVGASGGYFTLKGSFIHPNKYNYIGSWFTIIPRFIYEKFGLFDEIFELGYGDDVDFSFRLQANGYKIKSLNLPVIHLVSASFYEWPCGFDFRARNENLVRERWKDFLKCFQ